MDSHPDPYATGGTDIVMLQSGRFVVLWFGADEEYGDTRLWSSYSDDYGATWSPQVAVSDTNAIIPYQSSIVTDSAGVLYAVWEDRRGPDTYAAYFSRSDDSGESWLCPNVR